MAFFISCPLSALGHDIWTKYSEIHELVCNKLINIDGKACNNIPETVNKLALSAHLGHSCETGWNKHDSSYYYQHQCMIKQYTT